jgi:hypothetical protein
VALCFGISTTFEISNSRPAALAVILGPKAV